jgi:two-component system nitrogen regulation response regulator GlnG
MSVKSARTLSPGALDTRTLDSSALTAAVQDEGVPTLTILHHPDPARVGHEARLPALLEGRGVDLSRVEPVFAPPGATSPAAPLADPFLSRRPVHLGHTPSGGITLEPGGEGLRLVADGQPVESRTLFPPETLENGLVVELGRRVVLLLHRGSPPGPRPPSLGLVGDGPGMVALRRDVLRVADAGVPVLLRGETGTGKELVAQAIHRASPRSAAACVCVSMAAIPQATAASELFGHTRGAFTGAVGDHPGFFASAHGGTLFLDEIGETPSEVQVMLLRVLETSTVQPLGARAARPVDVRIVSATDADLEADVRAGRFRAPLLHRLSGYQILLPPLRARREDIGRLLLHFLRESLRQLGEPARLDAPPAPDARPFLSAALVGRLARHDWPGNVRQLRNIARQLVVSSRGLDEVRVDATVERMLTAGRAEGPESLAPVSLPPGSLAPAGAGATAAPRRRPADITDEELLAALRANRFRIDATAVALGVPRASLYMLIDRCPQVRKARDLGRDELLAAQVACGGDLDAMSAALEVSQRGLKLRLSELGLG